SQEQGEKWHQQFAQLGFQATLGEVSVVDEDALLSYDVPKALRHILHWYLVRQGVRTLAVRDDGNYYGSFAIFLRDPSTASRPIRERFSVAVACDDEGVGNELIARLAERGYRTLPLETLHETDAMQKPVTLMPGAFENYGGEADRLQAVLSDQIHTLGIEHQRYP